MTPDESLGAVAPGRTLLPGRTLGTRGAGRRALAGWLGLLVVLGACGGGRTHPGAGSGGIPSGYAEYRGAGLSFAYPSAWRRLAGGERFVPSAAVEVAGQPGHHELPPLISAFSDDIRATLDERVSQLNAVANVELPQRVVTATTPHDVAGAGGTLIEAQYDQALRSGGTVRTTQWDLVAVATDGGTADLRMAVPSDELDGVRDAFDTAMRTLRLVPRRPGA